jgi:hypothetical protein
MALARATFLESGWFCRSPKAGFGSPNSKFGPTSWFGLGVESAKASRRIDHERTPPDEIVPALSHGFGQIDAGQRSFDRP